MNITHQKYVILTLIAGINTLLSATFIKYSEKWYYFTPFLALESLINSFSSIMILGHKIVSKIRGSKEIKISHKNYIYVVPCYNESEEELRQTLDSLVCQNYNENDKRVLCIVCDGKVLGKGNTKTTDRILKNILKNTEVGVEYQYNTWSNTYDEMWDTSYDTKWDNMKNNNTVKLYFGKYQNIDYVLFIKEKNYGKRDSLVLIRRLCYYYNNFFNGNVCLSYDLSRCMLQFFSKVFYTKLDYIIGIDADTIFDINCTKELIKGIESDKDVFGCVGYVDINPTMNRFSLFTLYQYGEYMYSQCLKRYAQSVITQKVSCLSGCNQILRVSEETCGENILNAFNYLPKPTESIFKHIRSYASEDRNHVCLMLSKYPYVKTVQNINAIAYTNVPNNLAIFASQRRRWNLGANCNDMLLTYLPGINIFERISAFTNVLTFTISPFIFIATIYFYRVLFTNPPLLMLYLSIIMIIPFVYSLLIPLVIRPVSLNNTLYYYLSFITYLTIGSLINLMTYSYALINMDIIRWGKTRTVSKDPVIINDTTSDKSVGSSELSVNSLIYNFEKYLRKNNEDSQITNNNGIYETADEYKFSSISQQPTNDNQYQIFKSISNNDNDEPNSESSCEPITESSNTESSNTESSNTESSNTESSNAESSNAESSNTEYYIIKNYNGFRETFV
jgi:chitin synthase